MSKKNKKPSMADRMASRTESFDRAKDGKAYRQSTFQVADIIPDPNQARKKFDTEKLEELAESIEQHGLLTPIGVRVNPDGEGFILVHGERRWRAHKLLKREKIVGVIIDGDIESISLIENMQREDLTPIEEAFGLARLKKSKNLTNVQLAETLGKKRNTVSQTLAITELPDEILDQIDNFPHVTKSLLIEIAQIADRDKQLSLWAAVKQGRLTIKDIRAERKGEKKESDLSPTEKAIKSYGSAVSRLEKLESLDESDILAIKDLQKRINALLRKKSEQ